IKLIPTTYAEHIGKMFLDKEGVDVIFPDKNKDGKRYFPDGEVYTRFSTINELSEADRVVMLHSGAPRPNDGLVELQWLSKIISKSSAYPIELFFTYYPYGMQDNVFRNGEVNAAMEMTNTSNVDNIYVIDAHFGGRDWVKKHPITNISAFPLLKKEFEEFFSGPFEYVAPDKGSARRCGIELYLEKVRIDSHTVEIMVPEHVKPRIKGKTVGIVDDILETGGTMETAYDKCKECGAKEIAALITHGVLLEGIRRVWKKYDSNLYLTNTIYQPEIYGTHIDVADLILDTIKSSDSSKDIS
ncbi:MAG: ribose-phosphate diphosphokinase, partial [Candidatus Nanoarchaeia archaeon]